MRQKYIDQTQSLNVAFDPTDSPRWINQVHMEAWKLGIKTLYYLSTDSPRWINQVHMEAWKLGIKTLYYLRTDSVIKGDLGSRTADDCLACDG